MSPSTDPRPLTLSLSLCRQTEMDETLGALKDKSERERNLLTDDNRKLTSENDRVSESPERRLPGWAAAAPATATANGFV